MTQKKRTVATGAVRRLEIDIEALPEPWKEGNRVESNLPYFLSAGVLGDVGNYVGDRLDAGHKSRCSQQVRLASDVRRRCVTD